MKYYVTVDEDGKEIVRRESFDDFYVAMGFFSRYYRPRSKRSVLGFTTEVINGEFFRAYVTLWIPESLDQADSHFHQRDAIATKQSNAFEYSHTYFFLVESELGAKEADMPDDED